ncbi:MAG: hypothetical protein WBW37_09445, partial [Methyloceanibacter sp.]
FMSSSAKTNLTQGASTTWRADLFKSHQASLERADGISAFFRVASSQKLRNVLHERVRDPAQEAIDPLHDHYMLVAPDTGNSCGTQTQ